MYSGSGAREVREPASWLVAAVVLAIAFWNPRSHPSLTALAGPMAAVVGFLSHEAAHKLIAMRGGMKAEFVATREGLLVTAISTLLPIKILLPGYVKVVAFYRINPSWALYSVVAGPTANIAIAAASLAAGSLVDAPTASYLARVAAEVNAWLALFNLVPFDPLDGYKILRQDWRVWAVLALSAGIIYYSA